MDGKRGKRVDRAMLEVSGLSQRESEYFYQVIIPLLIHVANFLLATRSGRMVE